MQPCRAAVTFFPMLTIKKLASDTGHVYSIEAEKIDNVSVVMPFSMLSNGFPLNFPCTETFAQVKESNNGAIDLVSQAIEKSLLRHGVSPSTLNTIQVSVVISAVISEAIFAILDLLTTASRMIFAFAREPGLPTSAYLGRLSAT